MKQLPYLYRKFLDNILTESINKKEVIRKARYFRITKRDVKIILPELQRLGILNNNKHYFCEKK